MRVALLAGGTGGAKLAAGAAALDGVELAVIANTGDDVETLGLHVSPDPDLVTYWLAGEIDEQRGWGIRGDSFRVFERLAAFGAPDWFRLSDLDLATCLYRSRFLAEGGRPTDAQRQIARGLGVGADVLPMSDEPVRTHVLTPRGWRGLQEFLVLDGGAGPVESVRLDGIEEARPTAEVLAAIETADAIVVGPSNPVISIGPILALPGLREAIAAARAPVVAVSPFVAGEVVKGPTEVFMQAVGRPASAAGAASLYAGLLDGVVCDSGDPDPPPARPPARALPTLMGDERARARVAAAVLDFASELAPPA